MTRWQVLLAAAWCVVALGCAGGLRRAPIGRTGMGEIAGAVRGRVVYNYEGGSPFVAVIIPEFHDMPRCQADVYAALEALRPMTAFVAVEGRVGEVRHDEIDRLERRLSQRRASDLAQLADRSQQVERRDVVDAWRALDAFPRSALQDQPAHAAIVYEVVYQDEVRSEGMEQTELFHRAHRLARRADQARLPLPWGAVITARNRVFADKLRYYGQTLREPGRDVVPFPVGVAHVNDLTRRLRRSQTSYMLVLLDGCVPRSRRPAEPASAPAEPASADDRQPASR